MRLPRFLLACLLGLGVSLQGVAQMLPMDAHCPMVQAQAMAHSDEHAMIHGAAPADHAVGGDHRHDHHGQDHGPNHGDSGGSCHGLGCVAAGGPALIPSLALPASPRMGQPVPLAGTSSFQSRTVSLPGRPPSTV